MRISTLGRICAIALPCLCCAAAWTGKPRYEDAHPMPAELGAALQATHDDLAQLVDLGYESSFSYTTCAADRRGQAQRAASTNRRSLT